MTMDARDLRPSVLIVDNDPEIVELIREHLNVSYRTRTASDGAQAIKQFVLERDVVLLDLNMPRMNGLEAQQELQRLDATVPVIMLTGVQDVELLATALRNGAFSYLPKPYHPVYLMHLLAAALSQGRRS